jgi:hypothetical protein
MALKTPVGGRTIPLSADASMRYEERRLAIVRWCKEPTISPALARPTAPESKEAMVDKSELPGNSI